MKQTSHESRPRALLMQPSVQPPGGGNGVAAWMIQALHARFDLTVLTLEPLDVEPINRFYGTSIDPSRLTNLRAMPRLYPLLKRAKAPLALMKSSLLMRALHGMQTPYDLVLTANNEADLHRPGIQYVHYPTYIRPRPDVDQRSYHDERVMRLYYALCDRIAAASRDGIKRNLTLVNSDWTGRLMRGWYDGHPTVTLYPPVAGDFPDVPWEARAPGFVCVGRIAPEKNIERIIEILAAVRERFPEVRLHLVGTAGTDAYSQRVLRRVEHERAWVTLYENIPRDELVRLVASQRFGIHGMDEEHFGMAVAEMVRAGCVVWVPDGGGQIEIVAADPRLRYRSVDEAVASITRALEDDLHAQELRATLVPQRERFTEREFVRRFDAIIDRFLAAGGAPVTS